MDVMSESQRTALLELVEGLASFCNRNRRNIALRYLDVPSPAENADYYARVPSPRSIHTVKAALQEQQYTSIQQVFTDLKLVFLNGQEYHNKSSEVWRDADRLYTAINELWDVHEKVLGPVNAMQEPERHEDTNPKSSPRKHRVAGYSHPETDAIHSNYISNGMFANPDAGPADNPNPSGLMTTTMDDVPPPPAHDLAALLQMAQEGSAGLIPQPSEPVYPVIADYAGSPPSVLSPGIATPVSATPRASKGKGRAETKRNLRSNSAGSEDEIVEEKRGKKEDRYPDEDPGWLQPVSGYPQAQVLMNLFQKIKGARDPQTGRSYCACLLRHPPSNNFPDFYSKIRDPVTLEIVEARLLGQQYHHPEQFDRDVTKMFSDARRWLSPSRNEIQYGDVLTLQKIYQDASRLDGVTSPEPVVRSRNEDGLTRINTKDRVILESINFKGDTLKIGDWVHLFNEGNPAKPIIAQIWKLYKKKENGLHSTLQRGMSVMWYLRPEETVHPIAKMFYENEVFKTHTYHEHNVEDFVERCCVMYNTRYIRGRPKFPIWHSEMPTYVCQDRYKDKNTSKIKNWTSCIPEDIRVADSNAELDLFPTQMNPIKVRSPFAPAETPAEQRRAAAIKKVPSSAALPQQVQSISRAQGALPLQVYAATGPSQLYTQGTRPIEIAAEGDQFYPISEEIASKFRCDPSTGDLLWFSAPPAPMPQPPRRPVHSLAYLEYLAQRGELPQYSNEIALGRKRSGEMLER